MYFLLWEKFSIFHIAILESFMWKSIGIFEYRILCYYGKSGFSFCMNRLTYQHIFVTCQLCQPNLLLDNLDRSFFCRIDIVERYLTFRLVGSNLCSFTWQWIDLLTQSSIKSEKPNISYYIEFKQGKVN